MSSSSDEYRIELEKQNLKTMDDLAGLVKPLIKDATRLILKKSGKIPANAHLKSHFGGQPYFQKGEKWPQSKDGKTLEFIFQVFAENGAILPNGIKLVQFYYDFDECPWDTSSSGWLVKIYRDIDADNAEIITSPNKNKTVKYGEIGFEPMKSLPDWEGLDHYCETASKLSCVLDDDEPWGSYDRTVETLIGEPEMTSQLGGYPQWVQGDEHPIDPKFSLLFQIDSEEAAGLMWGDCGLVYVFYNGEKTEFTLQCY